MIKLTDEEKETLSYDDVAYLILEEEKKKFKIHDLFKKVIKVMDLSDNLLETQIADFFELVMTDKRFIVLDNGYIDLKINHSTKIIIDDDDDDYELNLEEEVNEDLDEEIEDNYDDDSLDNDTVDDELDDLVIIDDSDENEGDLL